MKRIIFLFLPFLPYLASAQVAKDTVTVLTLAQIPAGAIRDTTNITFVQDNGFKKTTFDSLYKYTRVKLLSLGAITSAELANALSNETGTGAAVFATSPALTTPNLGTPSAATLTNATGLPIATGLTGLGDANRIPYATSATAMTTSANFTYNGTTLKIGSATRANTNTTFLNVGAGVSSSNNYGAGLIHIGLNDVNSATIAAHQNTDQFAGSFFGLMRSRGTQAVPLHCVADDLIGTFQAQVLSDESTKTYRSNAAVTFDAEGNHSLNNVPGRIRFLTLPGNTTTIAERMRITSAGETWIGYTTDNGAFPLQVNGQIFATNATIATSDERYKENIQPLQFGLSVIQKLNPVTFNFITDGINNFSLYPEVGFIAQEVDRALATESYAKSIVKNSDDSEPDSPMGLATSNLIPLLVKAIQEQQQQIEALKARITQLENK